VPGSAARGEQHQEQRGQSETACRCETAAPERRAVRRHASSLRLSVRLGRGRLVEQLGELVGHGAAKLLGVHDGNRATIVARYVVADADRDQLDRRAGLDLLDQTSADGARDS